MNFLVQKCFQTFGFAAMVVGGMVAPKANAGIVYSTSTSGSPSNSNVTTPVINTTSHSIGLFGGGTSFSFNNTATTGWMGFQFNVGSSTHINLKALGINLFTDEAGTPSSTGSFNGSLTWQLYAGASSSSQATYTQAITNIGHGASSVGPNIYLGDGTSQSVNYGSGAVNATSSWSSTGTTTLTAGTTYTMLLTGVTIGSVTGSLNNDELHWNIPGSGNSPGGAYNVTGVGYTGSLAYSGGQSLNSTSIGAATFAFDIQSAPEPPTLILYSAAAGGFFLFSFLRWRKNKSALKVVAG